MIVRPGSLKSSSVYRVPFDTHARLRAVHNGIRVATKIVDDFPLIVRVPPRSTTNFSFAMFVRAPPWKRYNRIRPSVPRPFANKYLRRSEASRIFLYTRSRRYTDRRKHTHTRPMYRRRPTRRVVRPETRVSFASDRQLRLFYSRRTGNSRAQCRRAIYLFVGYEKFREIPFSSVLRRQQVGQRCAAATVGDGGICFIFARPFLKANTHFSIPRRYTADCARAKQIRRRLFFSSTRRPTRGRVGLTTEWRIRAISTTDERGGKFRSRPLLYITDKITSTARNRENEYDRWKTRS